MITRVISKIFSVTGLFLLRGHFLMTLGMMKFCTQLGACNGLSLFLIGWKTVAGLWNQQKVTQAYPGWSLRSAWCWVTRCGYRLNVWEQDRNSFFNLLLRTKLKASNLHLRNKPLLHMIIPHHVTMGKVPSLYWQGYTAWTTGFQCRPQFDNQRDVDMILQKLFCDGHGIHCLPFIEFLNPNQLWTEDLERGLEPFEERSRKMKLAMRRVRTRRKDLFSSEPLS